jgi:hypothetical protein
MLLLLQKQIQDTFARKATIQKHNSYIHRNLMSMKFFYYVLVLFSLLLSVKLWFKFADRLALPLAETDKTATYVYGGAAFLVTIFCLLFVIRLIKKR